MSVGRPLPHDAAHLHVTGEARYIDDIPVPPGCVHLAFGQSPMAAGRILSMDLDAVRSAPGVVAVWTAADFAEIPDCSASNHDEPLLATGEVHFLGQPVFLVIATSHLAARKAARLGKIEIEERKPLLTIDEALAANSRFEEGPRIWQKGDVAAALAAAPRRLSGQFEMGGQEHFYLEGQAALVLPGEDGQLVVHSSTQHPTEIQHKVAHALHLPMSSVRTEVRRMGGGFGGKESQGNWLAVACAVVADRLKRPAKMRYDRDDDMMLTGKRHDFRIAYEVGYDETGRVLAVDFTQMTRCGWAMDLSLAVADRAMLHADNAYDIPALRVESHRLRTNTQSATAFRGFGGPQGMLGIERVMDHLAHELGMDPLELRQRNFYRDFTDSAACADPKAGGLSAPPSPPGDISIQKKEAALGGAKAALREEAKTDATSRGFALAEEGDAGAAPEGGAQSTHYGQKVDDFILNALVARLAEQADYTARRAAIEAWNRQNPVLKKGIALTPVKFGISFTLTHLNQAGALVHVYQDGSILMSHGGTEMGQGLYQKVAQVAASRFGVSIDRVRLAPTDTAKVPNTSATAASSGSDLNGMAVQNACDQIRDRIAAVVAELHQARAEDVVFADDKLRIGGDEISFDEAVLLAYQNRVSLSAAGFYKTPDLDWDRIAGTGRPFYYFSYGAAISEVVIDTLTGENRILRADILHDCGASLNPALDIGQVEGAYVQGAGWLTTEELVWDQKGRLRTHAPSTYKIPACGDRPRVFNVALWDGENRMPTVYRSKAVGEPPFMLGISAFMALSDAVQAARRAKGLDGYGNLQAPATAERVLKSLTEGAA